MSHFLFLATCLRKECVPVKVSPNAELPNSVTEAEVLSDNQEPTKLYNSNDLIQGLPTVYEALYDLVTKLMLFVIINSITQ